MVLSTQRVAPALRRGLGWPSILTGSNPAAGAEVAFTVGGGLQVAVRDVRLTFVASAAAANRRPVLVIDDGTDVLLEVVAQNNITAGQSWTLHWAAEFNHALTNGTSFVMVNPLPVLFLPPGYRVRTVTTNLQAGDDYGAPQVFGVALPWGRGPEELG